MLLLRALRGRTPPSLRRGHRLATLLLVSRAQHSGVREFLQRAPVGYAIGMAGFDGTDLSRKLGNTTGALPFTAVFARSGTLVQRKLGETSYDELKSWTQGL